MVKDLVIVVLVIRLSISGISGRAACDLLPHRNCGFLPYLITLVNIPSKFNAKATSAKVTAGYSNSPYHCLNCSSSKVYQLQNLKLTKIKLEKLILFHEKLTLHIFSRERVHSVRSFDKTTTTPLPT